VLAWWSRYASLLDHRVDAPLLDRRVDAPLLDHRADAAEEPSALVRDATGG